MTSPRASSTRSGSRVSDARHASTLFDGPFSDGQQAILDVLEQAGEPLAVEQLAARTGRPLSQILADVTLLQIRGKLARSSPGPHGVLLRLANLPEADEEPDQDGAPENVVPDPDGPERTGRRAR